MTWRVHPLTLSWSACVTLLVATIGLSLGSPVSAHWPDLAKAAAVIVALQLLRIRYARMRERPLMALLDGACLLIGFATVYTIATYLAATKSPALWDERFLAWDAALGISAAQVVQQVRSSPAMHELMRVVYFGFFLQFGLIVPYTAGVRRSPWRMHQALAQIFGCALIALLCFTLMPSLNTIATGGYEDVHGLGLVAEHILRVRDGRLTSIRFEEGVQGLIQFPSMHAALAVIFAWDMRHDHKVAFALYGVFNALVIFSAIPIGAHYVVDVLAGVLMAALVIAAVSRLSVSQAQVDRPNESLTDAGSTATSAQALEDEDEDGRRV